MKFETLFDEWSVVCIAYGRIVRRLKLASTERVIVMATHGNGLKTPADRTALDTALEAGAGSITLQLSESQFARLKDKEHRPRRRLPQENLT